MPLIRKKLLCFLQGFGSHDPFYNCALLKFTVMPLFRIVLNCKVSVLTLKGIVLIQKILFGARHLHEVNFRITLLLCLLLYCTRGSLIYKTHLS